MPSETLFADWQRLCAALEIHTQIERRGDVQVLLFRAAGSDVWIDTIPVRTLADAAERMAERLHAAYLGSNPP